ncbi:unnamed protein product [Effrenium voratum]|uniref:Serine/threonine-protein phosphatase PGAM5, mitochondrial n=1 Tax=Effrenium voratum TaxID=2562239 RepID=A0AA36HVS1_9DINO|nr:unnamed protein product [Effrenium voratum]CAJ1429560.1 unnamed protein product [Effrenium voratum]
MWRRGSAWTALGRAVAFPGRRGWSLSQRYSSTGVTSQITGKRLASVAVGCLAFVSAGAVYDLMSQWVSKRIEEEWAEDWDEELADEEGAPKEMAAAFALARSLRYQRSNVGTRHLLFVRHAQPGEEAELSPLGLQQAELAAQRIFSQVGLSKYKVIFHAPSAEAKATADVIQKRLGKVLAKESDLLVEGVPMVPDPAPEQLQQLPKDVLFKDMVRAEGALRTHLWRPAGGPESTAEIVVGHGNQMRYVLCRALQLNPNVWSRFAAGHATVSWLEISSDGSVLLREFGGSGHLPPELRTYR